MQALVLNLISPIENVRVALLRATLRAEFLRRAFRDRAWRLSLLYLVSVALYFPLSLCFPLWVLAIGPLLWGVPHLFASFRFQAYPLGRGQVTTVRRMVWYLSLLWIILSFFRVYTDVFRRAPHWDSFHPGMTEFAFGVLVLFGVSFIFRIKRFSALAALGLFLPFFYLLWRMPMATLGLLILGHNFVAFFYWVAAAKARRERLVAVLATASFALLHGLVWRKVFDPVINRGVITESLLWSQLSIDQLGYQIAPWSHDWSFWYRCVCLYAFGQSIHYFIWLKVIPDLHAPSQLPTSVHTAWRFLNRDFGGMLATGVLFLTAIPLTVWGLSNFIWAHDLYFAMASGHAYFEIASLALLVAYRPKPM